MRIGYARVSTLDQNPDLQLEKLREAGYERVIVEKASGARADRPELTRLLNDMLRQGDTLVIWKLDRLARSLKQLIETAEKLKGRGIGLISLTDAIDTSSAGGMLVFHMLGAIAEFERALIRERTRRRALGSAPEGQDRRSEAQALGKRHNRRQGVARRRLAYVEGSRRTLWRVQSDALPPFRLTPKTGVKSAVFPAFLGVSALVQKS
jgi:DNA invertase Pin-like site-specific DNA recombinase